MAVSSGLSYQDVQEQLENGLNLIFQSGRFKDLLSVMASQKNYSLNNTLMIAFQKPNATMVMGYKEWLKQGRFVEKGEKAIKILAPIVTKQMINKINPLTNDPIIGEDGQPVKEKKSVIKGFKTASVFDVSQTTGKEIPSVRDFISRNLDEDAYMSKLYQDFKLYINDTVGFKVSELETEKGVGGYFNRLTNEIAISTNVNNNDTEKFRVLIHEYAHALLHGQDKEFVEAHRGHKEAQAESVAYVVSSYYGLDIGDISHGYIATWAQDSKLAMKAVEQIRNTANNIIDELQLLQKEKVNEFYNHTENKISDAKSILTEQFNLPKGVFEKEAAPTEFEAINRKYGIVLNLKIETDDKGHSYFRTNRNLIESLDQVIGEGNLSILNAKKVLGEPVIENKLINEDYQVKKIRNAGYVVEAKESKQVISEQFDKKDEALIYQRKAAMGQALVRMAEVKKEWNTNQSDLQLTTQYKGVKDEVAKTTAEYLNLNSKEPVIIKDNQESIAWLLMKNSNIKTVTELTEFIGNHKHVPSYKNININESLEVKPKENENANQNGRETVATR
ncbi:ArdC-like ssDNA-binding domain-containing protein [Solibacillus sp. FSL W7-1436]|uniref:ArdC-like ssDNA-binding domain-containing protein n=1 Tax=Solibacillus sp. FSL W7-1436 TaxID=2921705 RepID=UPI0030FCCF1A